MCTTYLFDEKHMSEKDNFACLKKEIEHINFVSSMHLVTKRMSLAFCLFKFHKIPKYLLAFLKPQFKSKF